AKVRSDLVAQVTIKLRKAGKRVAVGEPEGELCVDRKSRILFRVARSYPEEGHLTYWQVPRINRPPARWIVAIRLTENNKDVHDYVLIPAKTIAGKYRNNCARFTDMAFVRLGFRKVDSVGALAKLILDVPP